jgi:hypothetical protein
MEVLRSTAIAAVTKLATKLLLLLQLLLWLLLPHHA